MPIPTNFAELQAGFYNAFMDGMGLKAGASVQLLQPSNPLVAGAEADTLLWQYFNFLPPNSLTGSFLLSGGNQFLSNYQAVMSVLQAQPNDFEAKVGSACFDAWTEALRTGTVHLGSDVGTTFRTFAMFDDTCRSVGAAGAKAITEAYLDPIFAAQQHVLPYEPAGTKDVNFVPGYSDLATLLSTAPGHSFSVARDGWNTDVSVSWSKDSFSGFSGLWGGSSPMSSLSKKFSVGGVALTASFAHVGRFTAQPGNWYSSAAFGLTFHHPNRSPWIADRPIDWETTFGSDGNMQRYTSSLIVADTVDVTVTSLAAFSSSEREEIEINSKSSGLWPFYAVNGDGSATTRARFADDGGMAIRITSQTGVPIVLAACVSTASQYLSQDQ